MNWIKNIKDKLFKLFEIINYIIIAIVLSLVYIIVLLPYGLIFQSDKTIWYNRQYTYSKKDCQEMW